LTSLGWRHIVRCHASPVMRCASRAGLMSIPHHGLVDESSASMVPCGVQPSKWPCRQHEGHVVTSRQLDHLHRTNPGAAGPKRLSELETTACRHRLYATKGHGVSICGTCHCMSSLARIPCHWCRGSARMLCAAEAGCSGYPLSAWPSTADGIDVLARWASTWGSARSHALQASWDCSQPRLV